MYAIDYTDVLIIKINDANKHIYEAYDKEENFSDAKNSLICYWLDQKQDAILNVKSAKRLKNPDNAA